VRAASPGCPATLQDRRARAGPGPTRHIDLKVVPSLRTRADNRAGAVRDMDMNGFHQVSALRRTGAGWTSSGGAGRSSGLRLRCGLLRINRTLPFSGGIVRRIPPAAFSTNAVGERTFLTPVAWHNVHSVSRGSLNFRMTSSGLRRSRTRIIHWHGSEPPQGYAVFQGVYIKQKSEEKQEVLTGGARLHEEEK